MKYLIHILLLHFTANCCYAQTTANLWDEANKASQQLDLDKSRALLFTITRSRNATDADLVKAYCRLAAQDWKFYRDYNTARKRLDTALLRHAPGNSAWMQTSRMQREAAQYQPALITARKAFELASGSKEKAAAQLLEAEAVYQLSLAAFRQKQALDTALLTAQVQQLAGILEAVPAHPEAARLLLGISLLRQDGPHALAGWLAYLHFPHADSASTYLQGTADTLSTLLSRWNGNSLPPGEYSAIAKALAFSGFHQYAAIIAAHCDPQDARLQEITIYAAYLGDLEQLTNEYYRQVAVGKGNAKKYKRALWHMNYRLLQRLHLPAKGVKDNFDAFLALLEPRFGTAGFLGNTSSFRSTELALGHTINKEKKEVLQYGYKGSLTFIQLDMMASNGYIRWFTERGQNGGWSANDTVYQVREAYLNAPIRAWNMITDSTLRGEKEALFHRTVMNPAVTDTGAILEGISARLCLQALDNIHDSLYNRGLRGSELQLQFMHTFDRLLHNASIIAHEGRHSIDQIHFREKFDKASPDEREYSAKLPEIASAGFSRYLLGSLSAKTGNFGHNKANKRIVADAIAWLNRHKAEVTGYNENLPLIKQLYLLTDSQIAQCFREADPLYQLSVR